MDHEHENEKTIGTSLGAAELDSSNPVGGDEVLVDHGPYEADVAPTGVYEGVGPLTNSGATSLMMPVPSTSTAPSKGMP